MIMMVAVMSVMDNEQGDGSNSDYNDMMMMMMMIIMMILFIFIILIIVNNRTKIMTLLKLFRKRSISCRWVLISIVAFLRIYKWLWRLLLWYQYDYAHFSPGDDDDYDNVDDNDDHMMVVEVMMIMIKIIMMMRDS